MSKLNLTINGKTLEGYHRVDYADRKQIITWDANEFSYPYDPTLSYDENLHKAQCELYESLRPRR